MAAVSIFKEEKYRNVSEHDELYFSGSENM